MAKRPPMNGVERMLASKRRLVKRLKTDIATIRENSQWHIGKIEARIRVAETLIDALEKGTLKP